MSPLRSFVIAILACIPFTAQAADKPAVRIRFRATAFDEAIPKAAYLVGEDLRILDIPNNGFTREFTYEGAKTLRFITIDGETLDPRPLTPELSAATQRLRRAQAVSLQCSDEYDQTRRMLDTLEHQASERARPASPEDKVRSEALRERIRQLSGILSAAAKETEQANLLILRLESLPKPATPQAKPRGGKGVASAASPTAEFTFQNDGSYLLVFSAAGNSHQIMALDDAEGAFPYGSLQFVNLTGKALELRYPDRKVSLPTNNRTVVRNPARDHEYSLMEIGTKTIDGFEVGHTLRNLQDPDVRTLIFLFPIPDETHAFRSRSIEDRRPAGTAGVK